MTPTVVVGIAAIVASVIAAATAPWTSRLIARRNIQAALDLARRNAKREYLKTNVQPLLDTANTMIRCGAVLHRALDWEPARIPGSYHETACKEVTETLWDLGKRFDRGDLYAVWTAYSDVLDDLWLPMRNALLENSFLAIGLAKGEPFDGMTIFSEGGTYYRTVENARRSQRELGDVGRELRTRLEELVFGVYANDAKAPAPSKSIFQPWSRSANQSNRRTRQ